MGSQKIATTERSGTDNIYKCAKFNGTQGRDTAPDHEEVKSGSHCIVGIETDCGN